MHRKRRCECELETKHIIYHVLTRRLTLQKPRLEVDSSRFPTSHVHSYPLNLFVFNRKLSE